MALEELVKTFDPERRARINAMADCLLAGNQTLEDLRKGKEPPSEQVTQALNIQQAILVHQERMAEELDIPLKALTKYMQRSDVLLFLLHTYIHALDGELMVKIPYKRAVTLEEFNKPKDSNTTLARHKQPGQSRTRYERSNALPNKKSAQPDSHTVKTESIHVVNNLNGIDKNNRVARGDKSTSLVVEKTSKKRGERSQVTGHRRTSAKSKTLA